MNLISPRRVLALAVVALGLLAAPSAQAFPYQPITGTQFFTSDGVWNKPLATNAPLGPNSKQLSSMLSWEAGYYGSYINTSSYSAPVYTVASDQPNVHVTLDVNNTQLAADLNQVPLPPDAHPASGTDGHLVVWQPSTQTMWEFWRLYKDGSGNWHAGYAGKMSNVSSNPGYFQAPFGATASGLPLVGGLITLQEETNGVINHALAISVPHPKAGTFVFPAQKTDGDSTSSYAIPEGTRFRLPASLNIDALNLPRQTAMMAKAAQKYGMVVNDRGGAVAFKAEDPYLYTQQFGFDPYGPYAFGGVPPSSLAAAFPWQFVQAVKP